MEGGSARETRDFVVVEVEEAGAKLSETYSVMKAGEFQAYKKRLKEEDKDALTKWKAASEAERGEKPAKRSVKVVLADCTETKAKEHAARLGEETEQKRQKAQRQDDKNPEEKG